MKTNHEYDHKRFQEHIRKEHRLSLIGNYIKEIVYGGNDGIVTTFAVVSGYTGANTGNIESLSILTVIIFGLANLFADGAAMGLGNYLSSRAERDMYTSFQKKEAHEIEHAPEMEKEETIYLLKEKGYSMEDAEAMTALMMKNKPYWLEFMMTMELELPKPDENPGFNGIATFLSFLCFGSIPILPYFFISTAIPAFYLSSLFTAIALLLLGTLSGYVSKRNIFKSIFETGLIGGTSAVIAFFVGHLFR